VSMALPVAAGSNIFKYRDDNGVWHYSDRRPGANRPVEVLQLFGAAPEQQRMVLIEKRGTERQPQLVVINKNLAPVEVKFWFTRADNVIPLTVPASVLVPGRGELKIAEPRPQNNVAPMRFEYQMRWQLGDPAAKPDLDYVYTPPVPAEGLFTVAQGFDGSFSHNTPGSRYAIDIGMPIGSAVRAARGGEVVSVQDRHGGGGNSPAFRGQTNSIYVLHDDGTFGVYAHLRQRSALVQPGQRVRAGEILAQSGNTGYSTAPHLHFAVLRNAGLQWASVPFALATPAGPIKPVRGLALGAKPGPERLASRAR
jgi:murein DD-endopeptidase MepM/ murein hydrolase activator NlpD